MVQRFSAPPPQAKVQRAAPVPTAVQEGTQEMVQRFSAPPPQAKVQRAAPVPTAVQEATQEMVQRFSAPPPQAKVQQAGGERGLLSDVAAMVQRFSAAAPPPPLATNAPSPRTGSAPAEAPLRIKRPARVLNGDDLQDGEQHKQMATRGFTRATPLEAPAAAGLLPEVAAMVQRFSAAKIPEAAATPDVDIKAEYGDDGYIECINDQLGDMQAEATFSTAQHVATPLPLPGLKVAGVGYVGLPLCDAQAQQLRSLDAQAPRAITVSAKWNAVVQGFVETTRAPLGVLCGARAELRGLSVTGAGEGEGVRRLQVRAAGGALPFGTLLVQLPSDTTGGAVRVQRGTETKVYRFESSTAETYSFVSYYAGCSEARDTVTSGWRLCLEYDLVRATPGPLPTLFDPSHIIRTVAQAVEMWSRDPAGPAKLGCVEPPAHAHPRPSPWGSNTDCVCLVATTPTNGFELRRHRGNVAVVRAPVLYRVQRSSDQAHAVT